MVTRNIPAQAANKSTHYKKVSVWFFMGILLLITTIGFFIRASHRHHPMQGDESATYFHYVMPHSFKALYNYTDTNNHIFHTLLAMLSTKFRGSGPTALRLPAFLAGVAIVPAGGILAWIIGDSMLAGILAALLLSTTRLLVEFSVNARGYTLVVFFSLLVCMAAVQIARNKPNRWIWIVWCTAIVFGMWTMPIMLYPAAIFSCMLVLQILLSKIETHNKKRTLRNWAISVAICICITWFLYLPIILQNGLHSLFVFPWVKPHSLTAVWSGIPETVSMVLQDWFHDTSWPYWVLISFGLTVSVIVGFKRKDLFHWTPFIAIAVLLLFTLMQRIVIFARIWLFVLPLALIAASNGMATIPNCFAAKTYRWISTVCIVLFFTAVSANSARQIVRQPYFIHEDKTTLVNPETICKDVAPYCDGKTALVGLWYSSQYALTYYQILYTPGKIVDYKDKKTIRAFLAVGGKQDLPWLLAQNPGFEQQYGPLVLWKTYPHSKVYLAYRKAKPAPPQELDQKKAEE